MNSDTQYTGARFTTFPTTSRRAPGTPSRLNECSWTSCLTLSPSHCACDATASLVGNRLCESAAWRWSVLETGIVSGAIASAAHRKDENSHVRERGELGSGLLEHDALVRPVVRAVLEDRGDVREGADDLRDGLRDGARDVVRLGDVQVREVLLRGRRREEGEERVDVVLAMASASASSITRDVNFAYGRVVAGKSTREQLGKHSAECAVVGVASAILEAPGSQVRRCEYVVVISNDR